MAVVVSGAGSKMDATGVRSPHRLGVVEGPVDIAYGAGEPPTNKARYVDRNRDIGFMARLRNGA